MREWKVPLFRGLPKVGILDGDWPVSKVAHVPIREGSPAVAQAHEARESCWVEYGDGPECLIETAQRIREELR